MFNAQRPVLVLGSGVRLAGAMEHAIAFAHASGIPVAPTWGALDIMPHDDPLFIGSFGTHGTRYGNLAVQNADLIISVGSRLDSKSTGTPPSTFAPRARIIMVDIDATEINKFAQMGVKVEGVNEDAKRFFMRVTPDIKATSYPEWYARINDWKARYPICPQSYYEEEGVNPYVLVKALSRECADGDIICCDTGCTVAWMAQAFEFKHNQRFIHAWNQTPMGYGLPAAIGAHYATGKRIILLAGDGSFQMQNELATVAGRRLPIKIILLNNGGHAMCRQTQREWFNQKYDSTSVEGGLTFPDFTAVAIASGLDSMIPIGQNKQIETTLAQFLDDDKPALIEALINKNHDVIPKLFATKPLHDMQPYLTPEQLAKEMA